MTDPTVHTVTAPSPIVALETLRGRTPPVEIAVGDELVMIYPDELGRPVERYTIIGGDFDLGRYELQEVRPPLWRDAIETSMAAVKMDPATLPDLLAMLSRMAGAPDDLLRETNRNLLAVAVAGITALVEHGHLPADGVPGFLDHLEHTISETSKLADMLHAGQKLQAEANAR